MCETITDLGNLLESFEEEGFFFDASNQLNCVDESAAIDDFSSPFDEESPSALTTPMHDSCDSSQLHNMTIDQPSAEKMALNLESIRKIDFSTITLDPIAATASSTEDEDDEDGVTNIEEDDEMLLGFSSLLDIQVLDGDTEIVNITDNMMDFDGVPTTQQQPKKNNAKPAAVQDYNSEAEIDIDTVSVASTPSPVASLESVVATPIAVVAKPTITKSNQTSPTTPLSTRSYPQSSPSPLVTKTTVISQNNSKPRPMPLLAMPIMHDSLGVDSCSDVEDSEIEIELGSPAFPHKPAIHVEQPQSPSVDIISPQPVKEEPIPAVGVPQKRKTTRVRKPIVPPLVITDDCCQASPRLNPGELTSTNAISILSPNSQPRHLQYSQHHRQATTTTTSKAKNTVSNVALKTVSAKHSSSADKKGKKRKHEECSVDEEEIDIVNIVDDATPVVSSKNNTPRQSNTTNSKHPSTKRQKHNSTTNPAPSVTSQNSAPTCTASNNTKQQRARTITLPAAPVPATGSTGSNSNNNTAAVAAKRPVKGGGQLVRITYDEEEDEFVDIL